MPGLFLTNSRPDIFSKSILFWFKIQRLKPYYGRFYRWCRHATKIIIITIRKLKRFQKWQSIHKCCKTIFRLQKLIFCKWRSRAGWSKLGHTFETFDIFFFFNKVTQYIFFMVKNSKNVWRTDYGLLFNLPWTTCRFQLFQPNHVSMTKRTYISWLVYCVE